MMIEGPLLYAIGTGLFTAGAAVGGVKYAMNGTKARQEAQEQRINTLEEEAHEVKERMVRLETKIDLIYEQVK